LVKFPRSCFNFLHLRFEKERASHESLGSNKLKKNMINKTLISMWSFEV